MLSCYLVRCYSGELGGTKLLLPSISWGQASAKVFSKTEGKAKRLVQCSFLLCVQKMVYLPHRRQLAGILHNLHWEAYKVQNWARPPLSHFNIHSKCNWKLHTGEAGLASLGIFLLAWLEFWAGSLNRSVVRYLVYRLSHLFFCVYFPLTLPVYVPNKTLMCQLLNRSACLTLFLLYFSFLSLFLCSCL